MHILRFFRPEHPIRDSENNFVGLGPVQDNAAHTSVGNAKTNHQRRHQIFYTTNFLHFLHKYF